MKSRNTGFAIPLKLECDKFTEMEVNKISNDLVAEVKTAKTRNKSGSYNKKILIKMSVLVRAAGQKVNDRVNNLLLRRIENKKRKVIYN